MPQVPLDYRRMTPEMRAYFGQFGRPGYETTAYGGGAPDADWITETLPNGWTHQTRAGTHAARERYGPGARAGNHQRPGRSGGDALSRLAASGDPALALRARQLELLHLAAR